MSEPEEGAEELQEEVDSGAEIALQLVRHLATMNATGCEIPVEHEGHRYTVTVKLEG